MKLEDIGFYTLSENRCQHSNPQSPIYRLEILLTNACNFQCHYCRNVGIHQEIDTVKRYIDMVASYQLVNVRFSGGEPTMWKGLDSVVRHTVNHGVKRIAISTNGSAPLDQYLPLIDCGVNDFSISLDGCCAASVDKISGRAGYFEIILSNIKALSELTYVTVGVVLTEENINDVDKIVSLADNLGVSDIRIITAAQYPASLHQFTTNVAKPILNYRMNNLHNGISMRGLRANDSAKCWLAMDDLAIIGDEQFPCIIYARESGRAIGKMHGDWRQDRMNWIKDHNSLTDEICKNNCLDVCRMYNNVFNTKHSKGLLI